MRVRFGEANVEIYFCSHLHINSQTNLLRTERSFEASTACVKEGYLEKEQTLVDLF